MKNTQDEKETQKIFDKTVNFFIKKKVGLSKQQIITFLDSQSGRIYAYHLIINDYNDEQNFNDLFKTKELFLKKNKNY